MTSRNGSSISYTSYNLPAVINAGTGTSSTLSYGAFRNRYKQIAVTPGSTETTIYVAGLLEKVTRGSSIEYRHLIHGGQGAAAIHTRVVGGASSTYYLHRDHLGSPELITDSSGNEVVRPSFGAYGERRDGTDWSGPPSTADLTDIANTIRRGFTGHEHLDSVGLIHMNGRVYEPTAGRFLSADPIVHVGLSQSPNRYNYVWNNPLSLFDPSGFDPPDDCIIDESTGQCWNGGPTAPFWDECDWGGPWMAGWSQACLEDDPFWDHDPFADFDESAPEDAGSSGGGDGGGESTDAPVASQEDQNGKCWNGSIGIQGSLHGPVAGPVGIGVSGGLSIGVSYGGSLLDSRFFLQFQSTGMVGTGIYGGVGVSAQGGGGAVGYGINTTESFHSEASFGEGIGATAGFDVAFDGRAAGGGGYHERIPLGRLGVGVGAAAGMGVGTSSTVGFGSFRDLLNWASSLAGLPLPGSGTLATCD
jgi:RHS repeat-associated protein